MFSFFYQSYAKYQTGRNPPAYTPEYKKVLAKAGIKIHYYSGEITISDSYKDLCTTLLKAEYQAPDNSLFHSDIFWITMDRVHSRNKARIVRDITPSIISSAEYLFSHSTSGLDHLKEEIDRSKVNTVLLLVLNRSPILHLGFYHLCLLTAKLRNSNIIRRLRSRRCLLGICFPLLLCEVTVRPTMYGSISCPLIFSAARMNSIL